MHKSKGLGAHLKKVNNTACRPVSTTVVYTHTYGNRNHMDLCLPGSGGLRMCSSQTIRNITHILLFLDNLLMFYQAFGVNLSFNHVNRCGIFVVGVACTSIGHCASIRTNYSVYTMYTYPDI